MRHLSRIRVSADMIGDALGCAALIVILVAGIWIGHGAGLPTGGDQLLEVVR